MGGFFFELRGEVDTEWVFTDGSYVRAHQHASGARHGEERAIGLSRGGATTKIHIRSIATRFEKLARNFKSMLFLACSLIWLKLK